MQGEEGAPAQEGSLGGSAMLLAKHSMIISAKYLSYGSQQGIEWMHRMGNFSNTNPHFHVPVLLLGVRVPAQVTHQ